jgi:integrase/recombinase XerD
MEFLDHLEANRGVRPVTRNLRLSALRTFFTHLIRHDPSRAGQYQRVLSLPSKRVTERPVTYLEPEEVDIVLQQPDRRTAIGERDHALILFLYNTGARISEALSVRAVDLELIRPFEVRLHGKGRKERICPLWPQTVAALKRVIKRWPEANDGHVFRARTGGALGRRGAAYLLRKYVKKAAQHMPALVRKHVTPHTLRHSCAVALLQAGVHPLVIRDYLGHESVATTSRYTKTNLQMKRRVLEDFWRRARLTRARDPRWRPPSDMVAFLNSL